MPRYVRRRRYQRRRFALRRSRRAFGRRRVFGRRYRRFKKRYRRSARSANNYIKFRAVIVAGRESVTTDANSGVLLGLAYAKTMSDIVSNSTGLASIYSQYQYYRIRRAYLRMRPVLNEFGGIEQVVGPSGAANVSALKPRMFRLPYTTSFDSPPSNLQTLLEFSRKKEYSVMRTVRIPGACTVEDSLAPSGVLGQAYMPRKAPWIPMARTQIPHYMFQLYFVKPQRLDGAAVDATCQAWDNEWVFDVELKRMRV